MVIDAAKRERVEEIPIPDHSTFSVALSPDAGIVVYDGDDALLFHDLKTGKTAKRDKGSRRGASGLRFSPDGRYFISIVAGKLSVLDQKTFGVFAQEIDIGNTGVTDISKDGKLLAVNAIKDGKPGFSVFRLPELQVIDHEPNLPSAAVSFAFSPDGKYLAIGLLDGTARIWDLAAKKVTASWVPHGKGIIRPAFVAFSPDGKALATGVTTVVKIWDL